MANIGIFIERYTVSRSEEMGALMRLAQVALKMNHRVDFLFRPDIYKIPQYQAIFIRTLTDPMNSSYVVARLAQLNGLRVIDDPDSIVICCDKVNMYKRLRMHNVPMPETHFLTEADLNPDIGSSLLKAVSNPLVLKAPNSSFSMYVERVSTPAEFAKVGKRFLRRADRVVAQQFVSSEFDWRVGVLAGKPIYVCQYKIPKKRWKILTYTEDGRQIHGPVKGFDLDKVDQKLLDVAVQATQAIGNGLYGVDLKQVGNDFVVIEVNDNPTIHLGEEDQNAPNIYESLVRYLVGDWK
ncbi:MAG: ATP-grasp domain-containing protein [candidate division Zixibacteria bacterium]|nr:ATP-grasp domain-containing protein [candidate division Zixibacteria bacterium]